MMENTKQYIICHRRFSDHQLYAIAQSCQVMAILYSFLQIWLFLTSDNPKQLFTLDEKCEIVC